MKPVVRLHIRDRVDISEPAIGPGNIALLEAIGNTGSITAAAKMLGMSYRRAWLLVDETNRCLMTAAVTTTAGGKRGGGTSLTHAGAELVKRYRAGRTRDELRSHTQSSGRCCAMSRSGIERRGSSSHLRR